LAVIEAQPYGDTDEPPYPKALAAATFVLSTVVTVRRFGSVGLLLILKFASVLGGGGNLDNSALLTKQHRLFDTPPPQKQASYYAGIKPACFLISAELSSAGVRGAAVAAAYGAACVARIFWGLVADSHALNTLIAYDSYYLPCTLTGALATALVVRVCACLGGERVSGSD
jgi:hypothetical protein